MQIRERARGDGGEIAEERDRRRPTNHPRNRLIVAGCSSPTLRAISVLGLPFQDSKLLEPDPVSGHLR
jgi:hypothetical protein